MGSPTSPKIKGEFGLPEIMKTIRDFDVANKKVLVRADLNVPLSDSGQILDDFRIRQAIPTIKYLIDNGAQKIILMSHLGRPDGKVMEEFSLRPVARRLEELLGEKVALGGEGKIALLENLRFKIGEEGNDENFAKEFSKLGDIYINDAFGASHRAHASIVGVPKFLPSGAGFLLEKEIKTLGNLLKNPAKPLIAIIGGKKVEDKVKAIDKISEVADWVIVSGLIKKEIDDKNIKLRYPEKIIGPIDEIGGGKDVGPKTSGLFRDKIMQAKTVFWNGPLGRIEEDEFSKGSEALAKAIIDSKAFSVIGGGETVEFINKLGLVEKFNHVSTGGGAMLEFLSGEELPGLTVLK